MPKMARTHVANAPIKRLCSREPEPVALQNLSARLGLAGAMEPGREKLAQDAANRNLIG